MNNLKLLKKYGVAFGVAIGFILVFTFLISTLHYFDLLKMGTVSILKLLTLLISFFAGGFILSISATKKGWLEGLKFAIMMGIFLFLFQLLGVEKSFQMKDIVFYVLIFIASMFGGMVGIHVDTKKR